MGIEQHESFSATSQTEKAQQTPEQIKADWENVICTINEFEYENEAIARYKDGENSVQLVVDMPNSANDSHSIMIMRNIGGIFSTIDYIVEPSGIAKMLPEGGNRKMTFEESTDTLEMIWRMFEKARNYQNEKEKDDQAEEIDESAWE